MARYQDAPGRTALGSWSRARRRIAFVPAALLVLGVALTLAACGSDDEQAAAGGDAQGKTTLSMGFLNDFAAANVWTMEDCLAQKDVELKMDPFTQWADVQRAFQAGEIDLGVMGYQNLAQMVEAGFKDFKLVAGVNNGDTFVTVGDGVALGTWKDLEGKKVGIPPTASRTCCSARSSRSTASIPARSSSSTSRARDRRCSPRSRAARST